MVDSLLSVSSRTSLLTITLLSSSAWFFPTSAVGQPDPVVAYGGGVDSEYGWSVDVAGLQGIVGAYRAQLGVRRTGLAELVGDIGQVLLQPEPSTRSDRQFGWSVAATTDWAMVADIRGDGARDLGGTVWLYDLNDPGSSPVKLLPEDPLASTLGGYGSSIDISGDLAIVGTQSGPGVAYVFDLTTREQLYKLTNPGDLVGRDRFGRSVAISGNRAVVGAARNSLGGNAVAEDGSAYLYDLNSGALISELTGETHSSTGQVGNGGNEFGMSVDIAGDQVIVGSRRIEDDDLNGAGFLFDADSGASLGKLSAPSGAMFFGQSVGVSQGTGIIGAWGSETAYLFDTATLGLQHTLEATAQGSDAPTEFGRSVAISGPSYVVGSPNHDSELGCPDNLRCNTGAAYFYFGANEFRWIEPSGGEFSLDANWESDVVPGPTDLAVFDLSNSYTVELTENVQSASMSVRAGDVSLQSDSFRYVVDRLDVEGNAVSASLFVNSTNAVTMEEHGLLASVIKIGKLGTLRNAGQLYVGDVDFPPSGSGSNQTLTDLQATAAVKVVEGGVLRVSQARIDGPSGALVEVQGIDSTFAVENLFVGGDAVGRIDVSEGGTLQGVGNGNGILMGVVDSTTEGAVNIVGSAAETPSRMIASTLTVGKTGSGSLNLENGALARVDTIIVGDEFGSVGRLRVAGDGTRWTKNANPVSRIIVGNSGRGEMEIADGALVEASLAIGVSGNDSSVDEGVVAVRGEGSRLVAPEISAGLGGAGELILEGAATAESEILKLGDGLGGTGVVKVRGTNTSLAVSSRVDAASEGGGAASVVVSDSASFEVGPDEGFLNLGPGARVEIVSGGRLSATNIDQAFGGTAVVVGAGSTLTASESYQLEGQLRVEDQATLEVGLERFEIEGAGSLNIKTGGNVQADQVVTRDFARINITDPTSIVDALDVRLEGGEVEIGGAARISASNASTEVPITLTGSGEMFVGISLAVSGVGTVKTVEGAVTVGETNPIVGELRVGPGGVLSGTGTVVGTVRDVGGNVAPGFSPGVLKIDGDYIQESGGLLTLEIGGRSPGDLHDQLVITGDAMFDGRVILRFTRQFSPTAGDAFDLLQVDGIVDLSAASVVVENLAPGFEFDLQPTISGLRMLAITDGQFVPEPSALFLASSSLLVFCGMRRDRNF